MNIGNISNSRKIYISAVVLLAFSSFVSAQAVNTQEAQPKRGLITSARCPYSCRDAGIPLKDCRESQRGDVCEVEDFRQAPGHRNLYRTKAMVINAPISNKITKEQEVRNTRGLITSGECPLTCASVGVPAEDCKAWSEGDRCFVEDFRQAAGHRSVYKAGK